MNRIVSQVGAISISRFGQDVSTKTWEDYSKTNPNWDDSVFYQN